MGTIHKFTLYAFLVILVVACRGNTEPTTSSNVQILSPTSTPVASGNLGSMSGSSAQTGSESAISNTPVTAVESQSSQTNQQDYVPPTSVPVTIEGDQKIYQDPLGRFQLTFPEKFSVINSSDAPASIHFMDSVASGGEGSYAAISVFVQDEAADIEKIAATAIDVFREQAGMPEAELTVDKKIEFDGLQGIEQIMLYPLAGREMAVRIIYISHPQRTYAVSITTLQSNLAAYDADVESFLRGIQIQ